eukprot:gene3730-3991_t
MANGYATAATGGDLGPRLYPHNQYPVLQQVALISQLRGCSSYLLQLVVASLQQHHPLPLPHWVRDQRQPLAAGYPLFSNVEALEVYVSPQQ